MKISSTKLLLGRKATPKPISLKPLETSLSEPSPIKMKRQNSRRRLTKITNFAKNTDLSKVLEEADEDSDKSRSKVLIKPEDLDEIKETGHLSQIVEIAEISDKHDDNAKSVSDSDMQIEDSIKGKPKLELEESFSFQKEVKNFLTTGETYKVYSKRRSSSFSENRGAKIELMEALLDEDDKEIEQMKIETNKFVSKFSSEKDILKLQPNLTLTKLVRSQSDDDIVNKLPEKELQDKRKSDVISRTSMDVSSEDSDFSSSGKKNKEYESEDDEDSDSQSSEHEESKVDEDEEDFHHTPSRFDKSPKQLRRRKKMFKHSSSNESLIKPKFAKETEKSEFDISELTQLGSLFDSIKIPLKKGVSEAKEHNKKIAGLNKKIKESEDNDRVRDEMNRKYIIKKFNEIKAKDYVQADQQQNDPTIDANSKKKKYVMHVTEPELKIIRKNRNLLIDLGAMLFWDHKYDSFKNDAMNEKKIEFQISGDFAQVERAKEATIFLLNYERKIEKEQVVLIEIDMWVPKILIRKIVGYHEKNVIDYYKKFDVSITYDANLVNDESYPMHEETMITVKGKKAYAEIVSSDINSKISQLVVRTIHLAPADCKYLKEKICQLKCRIDPAELRICRTTKQQKLTNMNHPFFHIPAYYKEVLVIGDKEEVYKAE